MRACSNRGQNRLKAAQAPEVVALHPKALERYLKTLTRLSESLSTPHQPEAMKLVRELVDSVVVYERKDGESVQFDVRGRLSALLNIADGTGLRHGQSLSAGLVVPRDRIELPTRGFSIRCSTD